MTKDARAIGPGELGFASDLITREHRHCSGLDRDRRCFGRTERKIAQRNVRPFPIDTPRDQGRERAHAAEADAATVADPYRFASLERHRNILRVPLAMPTLRSSADHRPASIRRNALNLHDVHLRRRLLSAAVFFHSHDPWGPLITLINDLARLAEERAILASEGQLSRRLGAVYPSDPYTGALLPLLGREDDLLPVLRDREMR